MEQLLRVDQVGERLGIGRTHVWRLVHSGELPVVRLGKSVRIPEGHLVAFVAARVTGGGAAENEIAAGVPTPAAVEEMSDAAAQLQHSA